MYDVNMERSKQAPAWFWICLALLVAGSLIAYLLVKDGRTDQMNMEKKTTYFQYNNELRA